MTDPSQTFISAAVGLAIVALCIVAIIHIACRSGKRTDKDNRVRVVSTCFVSTLISEVYPDGDLEDIIKKRVKVVILTNHQSTSTIKDTISFRSNTRRIICAIRYIHRYKSPGECIRLEWPLSPVAGATTIEEAINSYDSYIPDPANPIIDWLGVGIKFVKVVALT